MNSHHRYTDDEEITPPPSPPLSDNDKKRNFDEDSNPNTSQDNPSTKKTKTGTTVDEFLSLFETVLKNEEDNGSESEDDGDDGDNGYTNNESELAKPTPKWTRNLNETDTKIYMDKYNHIKQGMRDKSISEIDILKSNLPFDEKVKLMELLEVLKEIPERTGERYELAAFIRKKLDSDKSLTQNDMDLEKDLNDSMGMKLSLKAKILRCSHPDKIKQILYEKYLSIAELSEDSSEYAKTKQWIENAMSIPTFINPIFKSDNSNELSNKLVKIKNLMTKKIYGQSKAKERILDIISTMFTSTTTCGSSFAMVGKPGVGKTMFAKCLAKALDLPFYQISMGGIKDSHSIMGHSETYIGSKYGEIARALISMKQKNGILLLDEFDKVGSMGTDVSNAFLHILDYAQNNAFKDEYMPEVPLDLSKLIIIVSVNKISKVNYIVADRLPLIYFKDYDTKDKIKIGLDYFVPIIEKKLKFTPGDVKIDKSVMKYIINKSSYSDSAGVRQLERNLLRIYERLNTLRLTKELDPDELDLSYRLDRLSFPLILTKKHIDILFDEGGKESNKKEEKIYK